MITRTAKILLIALLLSFTITGISFCQDAKIIDLVDKYCDDTDIQKAAIAKEYTDKKIVASGIVADVSDENTFDVVNDVERHYYKVVTDTENTPWRNSYRAILIYKDINTAKNINKGQPITLRGNIIKVVDDRLYLSVWLSADELTEHEKELFK